MGEVWQLVCSDCGKQYQAHSGAGMEGCLEYCTGCGKTAIARIVWPARGEPKVMKPKPCPCGGTWTTELLPCCPHCGSKSFRNLGEVGMWD